MFEATNPKNNNSHLELHLALRTRTKLVLTILFTITSIAIWNSNAVAQVNLNATADQVQALLDGGEFAPAIALTEGIGEGEARDRMLAQIAQRQFASGTRNGAFSTAGEISGDEARSVLLSDLARQRFGAGGGGALADFEPLMELIQSTIAPDTWADMGGTGTMSEFRAGVSVDASGTLRRIASDKPNPRLESLRKDALKRNTNSDVFRSSPLRKVSLTRLEKQYQMRVASGLPVDLSMQYLAGIYEIRYLLVYPKTGDIVIAGPAGPWIMDIEGRQINVETGKPVLRLDDFVVCLRNAFESDGRFGCSIEPRKANLQATQRFLATSKLKGKRWRDELHAALGNQDIKVDGIDARTATAKTIVEADYRMKLVGMGLEDGVAGVKSYLDHVKLDKAGNPPPMDIARWWFTLNYDGIVATEKRDAFEMIGTGVKVLSEQEMLNRKGERVHTGKSAGPTLEFADSFTTHFESLAEKYPIYAELRNVFDFALVAAIIRKDRLDQQVDWHRTFFGKAKDGQQLTYMPALSPQPKEVASVMNHKLLESKRGTVTLRHTIVGVSGGVQVACSIVTDRQAKPDQSGKVKLSHNASQPQELAKSDWWWD